MDQTQQIILVTGATSGFGLAITKRYLREGHKVIAIGRRQEKLLELKASVSDHEKNLHCISVDVRDTESVLSIKKLLPVKFAGVSILVNNAGLGLGLEKAHEADLDDWEQMVDTNIKGLMRMTRVFLPEMVANNRGHIINIASTAASYPYPGGNVYGGTKAFVEQFSRNLKSDLLGTAVRVTSISPGLCSGTEFSKVRFKGDIKRAEQVYQGVKALNADDIAEAVYWVSMQPRHVNINAMEIMPTCQAAGPLLIHRDSISLFTR